MAANNLQRAEQAPRVRAGVVWCHATGSGDAVVANHYVTMPPVVRPFAATDLEVLSRCDGTRTLIAIADELQAPLSRIVAVIDRWEALAPRMFGWPDSAAAERRLQQRLLRADRIHRQWRAATEVPSDNDAYHRDGISDAARQFDRNETTVSHAFRDPHGALRGRRYGEAFGDTLIARGALRPGVRIVEIGGGVGYFASTFLTWLQRCAPAIYDSIHYTIVDLSPALQSSQQQLCRAHHGRMSFVQGNIETMQLPPGFADVVLANEMIGDLSIGSAETARVIEHDASNEAEALIRQYELAWTTQLPRGAVNVGAIRLVEHLASWLAPGGTAILTEYGSLEASPAVVPLDGHNEYSIHFGHLQQVARACQMEARIENLGTFLDADAEYEVVRNASLQMLRHHLLPRLGSLELPARTYDMGSLQRQLGEWWPLIGNIQRGRLRSDGWMTPFGFQALTVRRASVAGTGGNPCYLH